MLVSDAQQPDSLFSAQLAAGGALLSARLKTAVRLTGAERLTGERRRNLLLRCAVDGAPDGGPTSVIVKQVQRDSPDPEVAHFPHLQRLVSDWAGAEFLDAVAGGSPHGPRFYGGDRDLGLIVLEDLGEHRSLVEPLLEGDAATAEQGLVALAARLGAMHADTIGGAARYEAIARAIDPTVSVDAACLRQAATLQERANRVEGLLERLGAPAVVTGFAGDVAAICEAVAHPGPFLAYTHTDPCPDNTFFDRGRLRLIDFEFGGFSHALRDGACGRMQFPTCWCANRLPDAVLARMESSYRTELARGCPAAQDDRSFAPALAVMCGYWTIVTLPGPLERAIDEDQEWGIATLRPRILARLEAFIATADAFARLPALRGTAEALLATLRRRWPDVSPLPLYPAFR